MGRKSRNGECVPLRYLRAGVRDMLAVVFDDLADVLEVDVCDRQGRISDNIEVPPEVWDSAVSKWEEAGKPPVRWNVVPEWSVVAETA